MKTLATFKVTLPAWGRTKTGPQSSLTTIRVFETRWDKEDLIQRKMEKRGERHRNMKIQRKHRACTFWSPISSLGHRGGLCFNFCHTGICRLSVSHM